MCTNYTVVAPRDSLDTRLWCVGGGDGVSSLFPAAGGLFSGFRSIVIVLYSYFIPVGLQDNILIFSHDFKSSNFVNRKTI